MSFKVFEDKDEIEEDLIHSVNDLRDNNFSVGDVLRGRKSTTAINHDKQERAKEREKLLDENIENEKYYRDYNNYKRLNAIKMFFSMSVMIVALLNYAWGLQ